MNIKYYATLFLLLNFVLLATYHQTVAMKRGKSIIPAVCNKKTCYFSRFYFNRLQIGCKKMQCKSAYNSNMAQASRAGIAKATMFGIATWLMWFSQAERITHLSDDLNKWCNKAGKRSNS